MLATIKKGKNKDYIIFWINNHFRPWMWSALTNLFLNMHVDSFINVNGQKVNGWMNFSHFFHFQILKFEFTCMKTNLWAHGKSLLIL